MRTVIRLQNHGCQNHPYWWIVIMGHYRNPRGRFVEHVGYWIPMKRKTVQRSVILNKPRIQYWLAMGAQPSKSVHRMLSFVDFMPKPLIAHGGNSVYEKPAKPEVREGFQWNRKVGPYKHMLNVQIERDEMNMATRELKAENELKKNIGFATPKLDDVELYESDIDDKGERSQQFYALRQKFTELEKDTKKLNTHKRELLYRKMNKLAASGISQGEELSSESSRVKLKYNFSNDEIKRADPESIVKNQIKYAKLMEDMEIKKQKVEKDQKLLTPLTRHEFKAYLVQKRGYSLTKADREVTKTFEKFGEVTVSDMMDLDLDIGHYERQFASKIKVSEGPDAENLYIPTSKTITPFPDIATYDPTNYFEKRPGYSEEINTNKPYASYRDNAPIKVDKAMKRTYKHNKGRKTKRRTPFSTINKVNSEETFPKTAFACQPSLTQAYTGLMRKIGGF